MPDPTHRPELGFPESVARRLRMLAEFDGRPAATLGQVHDALLELATEVRQLRRSLEPSTSPLITGGDAMRQYRALTTPRT